MTEEEKRIIFEQYKIEKKKIIENDIELKGIAKSKVSYPIIKQLLKFITMINGEKINWISEKNIQVPKDRTIIFANTHRFKPDFEKITIETKQPSFVMASDFINSYGTISGWYFNSRPTIFVDPYSKEDKKYSFLLMKKYLESGMNCTIFPEAVWNLSPNRIILDTFYGTVKAALETNSVIICTGIERYGKDYFLNRSNFLDLNKIVNVEYDCTYDKLDNETKNNIVKNMNILLRDTMATLIFEIWEYYTNLNGLSIRKEIPDDYWDKQIESFTSEWPGYKMSDNIEQQYQNKDFLEQYEVERDLKLLKKI